MTAPAGIPQTRCLSAPSAGVSRLVGDPVDIVTGALVDQEVDFRLPRAAVALSWVRRFDSRQLASDRGLGFGFRHELDRELCFDLDGMTYVDAAWERTSFPHLERDGQQSTQSTLRLERVDARRYRVHEPDERVFEFSFATPDEPGRLERVFERERSLALYYERVGGAERLSGVGLGMLGRLHVTWTDGRIRSMALQETEPERETELVRYAFDERGCLLEARNAYKHSLRYDFDARLRLTKKTDRRGYAFSFEYDAAGRCVRSAGQDGAEAVSLQYLPVERTTLVTRHDGGTWRYQYNDAGTVTHILDPYGGMQAYVLDGRGRVVEEIDPLGNASKVRYDARGVPAERVDVFGQSAPLPEDPNALRPQEHRVAQTPLEWEYGTLFEAPARLPVTGDPLWDLPFQVRPFIQTAEPEWGGHAHMERNLQGLPVRELREDSKSRRWMFDENANVRKQVDFDGHLRSFEYASDNHLVSETDALGRITRYERSASEELTAITDAGGTRSEYVLDQKDRVVEVRRHGKVRERYSYDLADNVVEKHDGSGELLLEQTFGAGNRKLARRLGSGEAQTFDYDERGLLTEARGAAGSCTFSYAHDGTRSADLRDGRGVEHELDARGTRSTTVLGRFTTRYYQRSAVELTLVDPTSRSHTLSRLGAGVYQRKLSNGAREVSQFDVDGRCLAKALYRRFEDDQPWVRGFRYSGEGDLQERQESQRGTTRFIHDAAHRLQRVIHPSGRTDTYDYDAADNLLSLPSSQRALRELGENDRLDVAAGNRLRAARGERFAYDDRDHVCRRELGNSTTYYRHDALDQLLEIRGPETVFSARYDPLGRRTHKTVNGATTTYYWDSDRLAAELLPNGALRVYVYPAALALVPLLFVDYASVDAAPESGAVFFVASDHRGAVEQVLDLAGEPVWSAQHDPYGLAHVESREPFHQPLRFPGHLFDSETGLHYNRFRYYDPKLGRYLESDPIGIEGGLNLYAYTRNPLREVDVRGLSAKCPNGKDCPKKRTPATEANEGVEGNQPGAATAQPGPQKGLVPVTPAHEAKLRHLAPGVNAHDVALAEHHNLAGAAGSTQLAARKRVARAFYVRNGKEYALRDEQNNPYGVNAKTGNAKKQLRSQVTRERKQQLAAIDYSDPVVVGPPPPCKTDMKQWQAQGGDRGSYFADDGVPPDKLGIGPDGKSWNVPGQPVGPKVSSAHAIDPDTPYLETTAGPAIDDWSVPGRKQPAPGGGRQTYIPEGCDPNSSTVQ